jgi:hypothetical protein
MLLFDFHRLAKVEKSTVFQVYFFVQKYHDGDLKSFSVCKNKLTR